MGRGGYVGEQDLPEFKPLVYIALIFPFVSFHLQNLFYLNPLRMVDPFVGGIRLVLESSWPSAATQVRTLLSNPVDILKMCSGVTGNQQQRVAFWITLTSVV